MLKPVVYFYMWFIIIGMLLFLPTMQGITGAAVYTVDSIDVNEKDNLVVAFVTVSEDLDMEKKEDIVESILLKLRKEYDKDSIVILKNDNEILGNALYRKESETIDVSI